MWGAGGRGPKARRGDVRAAILAVLAEQPRNGYQIIQEVAERSGGAWKPSPGSIYPTLQLLADEGLVTAEQVGERKVYTLTEAGREAAKPADADDPTAASTGWNPSRMREQAEQRSALPKAGAKLAQALATVQTSGTHEQSERAIAVIDEARRKLYAILAEDTAEDSTDSSDNKE